MPRALLLLALSPLPAAGFYNGMPAEAVFGQPNFTTTQVNQGATASSRTLNSPGQIHAGNYGGTERLFVLDKANNRVLVYDLPASTANAAASAVIGQPDFTSTLPNQGGTPSSTTLKPGSSIGLVGDGVNLFVADGGNNRVLIYQDIAAKIAAFPGTSIAADVVIGQPDFVSSTENNGGRSAKSVKELQQLFAVRQGTSTKLLIVDRGNTRVLVFNEIPAANFASADLVVGQADFASAVSVVNQSGLASPFGVWSDGTKLAIVEIGGGRRVLLWDSFPTVNGQAADRVLCQPSFIENLANAFGSGDARSCGEPNAAFYDGSRLFVSDTFPNGVKIFDAWPTQTFGQAADSILGTKGFPGGVLARETGITFGGYTMLSATGTTLYAGDSAFNRVIAFPDEFGIYRVSPGTLTFGPADIELIGGDFLSGSSVALALAGQTDIPGTGLAFSSATLHGRFRRITGGFDLSGVKAGVWTVVLSSGGLRHEFPGGLSLQPFSLSSVLPNFGYDHGSATLFIKGSLMPPGAALSLTRSGQDPIAAKSAVYHSTAIVQGTFDLRQSDHGLWSVTVTSGATSASLADSFVIGRFPSGSVAVEATKSMTAGVDEVLTVSVSNNGLAQTTLLVPSGAIPGSLTIEVSIGALLAPPRAPDGFVFFKTPVELSPSGMEFSSQVSLELPYDADELAAIGLNDASGLVGKTYDSMAGRWTDATTTVDAANRKIKIDTTHFSAFGVMAKAASDFSSLKIFPNPLIPAEGHGAMRFTSVPPGTSVKIYTVAGDLVRDIPDGGSGTVVWDGRNAAGASAASGVYVAVLKAPNGSARRLVAIER